jgi:hypothetical protein
MSVVRIDPRLSDEERRRRLYDGEIHLLAASPASRALCDFAREMVEAAFPGDPRRVHERMPVEACVAVLAELKPRFIHHPLAKALLQQMLREFGCDADETYFDVPRLRTAMPMDYLTAGIAYAFHPHRDTWYSAPFCQLNWWLPVYDLDPDNAMAFHPRYWREPVKNSSAGYDYARWNAESRQQAARHIKTDTRVQPRAEEPLELEPQLRLLCPPGGVILFSGAQLHSTVPNTTGLARYSIDFRTVNGEDVRRRRGAPNIDSACTGTTLRDFLRVSDLAPLPDAVVALHDVAPPATPGAQRMPETVG